jgi:hypothetical protein
MYAQDEQKRDVVIKLIQTDSVEHRIHQRLISYTEFNHSESFPFVIPTLEILSSPDNFSFVIMPRWVISCLLINGFRSLFRCSWGTGPRVPHFRNVRELLSFITNILQVRIPHHPKLYIHSDHYGLLKGLHFLHSHRIVHLVRNFLIVDHASQPISHLAS